MTSPRLRVAMLAQQYYPLLGGAERQIMSLAPLLVARGVDIVVLTRQYPGLQRYEELQGVPVHRLPIPGPKIVKSMMYTYAAQSVLARVQPDVLHAHELLSPTTTAIIAKRRLKIPVLAKVLRGGTYGDLARIHQKPFAKRRLRTIRNGVDVFVSISTEITLELRDHSIADERIRFIPNGVDTDRFSPVDDAARVRIRKELDQINGPIAVYTGRFVPEKRVDQLVEVWPLVRTEFPDATLFLLGTGSETQKLMDLAGDGVHFVGQVDDVVSYLRVANAFVLPSVAEGLSNAMLEAMATGAPVVVTRVGGAPDLVDDGVSGCMIPPDSPDHLRDAILALFRDPAKQTSYGAQARKRVLKDYALSVTADRLVALYRELARR